MPGTTRRRKAPAPRRRKPAELTVRVDGELHASLVERARAEDRSLAALVRTACRHYLEERAS